MNSIMSKGPKKVNNTPIMWGQLLNHAKSKQSIVVCLTPTLDSVALMPSELSFWLSDVILLLKKGIWKHGEWCFSDIRIWNFRDPCRESDDMGARRREGPGKKSSEWLLPLPNLSRGSPNNPNSLICLALLFVLGAWPSKSVARTLQDVSMYERNVQWMAQHGRVYEDDAEKETRYSIFKENVARIDAFDSQTGKSYKLGVNRFADLSNEEFKASRDRFKGHMCSPKQVLSDMKISL
ncbi:hypothetical protein DKX38_007514 [Salix brachista]|uniref:Cathepsin propeptide inhibitor domain-containing protein n=1 Tax=Salix brachista TaxID=2182728 RepID=A0A5N5MN59_9ROSI|nr:hypothetical protein DKX38_007514 [Salix brachista]